MASEKEVKFSTIISMVDLIESGYNLVIAERDEYKAALRELTDQVGYFLDNGCVESVGTWEVPEEFAVMLKKDNVTAEDLLKPKEADDGK